MSEAFKTTLSKRLEACEEAVATAKEIHSINESNIVYTSKEGYIRIYSFNAANAMNDLLTKLNIGIKEAKDIADKARKETHRIDNLSKEEAEEIAAKINEYGGKAVVEKN